MPLTIAIGYRSPGRTAEPELLYLGQDATAAAAAADAPPPGITRTELIKAPIVTRRRHFAAPAPAAAAPQSDPSETSDPSDKPAAAPPKRKPSSTDH